MPSAELNMMSFFVGPMATMSTLTVASPPNSCTAWQYLSTFSFMTGFVFNTLLSSDGLIIFLVSNIAITLFATPLLTVALGSMLVTAALALYRAYGAYCAFLALGSGLGLPSSLAGFCKAIRIARYGPISHGSGFLQQLSLRQGSTPYTIGTVPQRQLNQQSPEDVQQYFADRLALFAMMQSDESKTTTSTASVLPSACDCISSPGLRTFGCSVCCPQRSNCGAHVVLHPADFEQVIRTGRGEMHPLANSGSPYSPFGSNACLPGTLTFVYAPREYNEVCTVMRIIEAGAKYMASIDGKGVEVR